MGEGFQLGTGDGWDEPNRAVRVVHVEPQVDELGAESLVEIGVELELEVQ